MARVDGRDTQWPAAIRRRTHPQSKTRRSPAGSFSHCSRYGPSRRFYDGSVLLRLCEQDHPEDSAQTQVQRVPDQHDVAPWIVRPHGALMQRGIALNNLTPRRCPVFHPLIPLLPDRRRSADFLATARRLSRSRGINRAADHTFRCLSGGSCFGQGARGRRASFTIREGRVIYHPLRPSPDGGSLASRFESLSRT